MKYYDLRIKVYIQIKTKYIQIEKLIRTVINSNDYTSRNKVE